jgi:hypothetical protein
MGGESMPVLSIIACEMLEEELVYILSKDYDLDQLIVVENRQSFRFVRKLKARNCRFRLYPMDKVPFILKEVHSPISLKIPNLLSKRLFSGKIENNKNDNRKKGKRVTIVVNVLRLGLHIDSEILKSEVYRNLREMTTFSDGILIFYGKCGDSLKNLESDFEKQGCPLYFLKDVNGKVADDCISVALGGNDTYSEVLKDGSGTGAFFLTPMWASSWKEMKSELTSSSDFDENYLKSPLYNKVIKINNEIFNGEEFDKDVLSFAHTYDMSIVEMKGSIKVSKNSYMNAKNDICK